ncbi:cellulose binding domain-containing protein, partial [Phytohabitans houttuyneae]
MRLLLRTAVAGVLVAATILIIAAPAQASAGHFTKSTQWSGGYVGEFTVHNHTDSPMNGWVVRFCLPSGTRILNGWNIQLTQIGDCYTFRNYPWNSTLPAGGAVSFGFVASGTGDPI